MHDPVYFPTDGKTYERSAIVQLIQTNSEKSEADVLIGTLSSNKRLKAKIVQVAQEW
jgi:hypothetical protein